MPDGPAGGVWIDGKRAGFDGNTCLTCDQTTVRGEPDPCLGVLPGVANACCGHGVQEPYVQFESSTGRWQDRTVIRGDEAARWIRQALVPKDE